MYKNYLFLLLLPLLAVFTSCQNKSGQLDQQRKDAFIQVNKILESGNADELDAYIAENAVDHQAEAEGGATGLAGIKDLFRNYHKIFPDLHLTVHTMAVSGDTLFGYVTFSGTPNEPFMGMPANQPISSNSVDMIRFEGDKMVEHWGFIDMSELMKMMPKDTTSRI
jgi:predicted ester cyclase